MAAPLIKHLFQSAKSDGADNTLVQPGDWNAAHTGVEVAAKTATESVTSSTTFQNDNDLSFAIGANEVWVARLVIVFLGANGGDLKTRITGPASMDALVITGHGLGLTAAGDEGDFVTQVETHHTANTMSWGAGSGTGAGETVVHLDVYVDNGANAGTIQLQWAQDTSSGTATTLQIGSHLFALRVS